MSEFRTIEIDFDVHKAIETERQSFSEPPNAVLRRLLGLSPKPAVLKTPSNEGVGCRTWNGEGVVLPHGTKLRMSYNRQQFEGEIIDGAWVISGKTFDSPSGAAGGGALTKDGKHPPLNGWIYWEVKRPSDAAWTRIDSIRQQNSTSLSERLLQELED